jgi:type 1 glutamine amidotransferase
MKSIQRHQFVTPNDPHWRRVCLLVLMAMLWCFAFSLHANDSNVVLAASGPAATNIATPLKWRGGTKVLLVGGGSSHDFHKWFDEVDGATLRTAGMFSVNYTESSVAATKALAEADVLVLSTNQKDFDTPEFRAALVAFADSGKGIVLLHPAVWYNWPWPEYNARFVGGGSRDHEPIGEFTVNVLKEHPVTLGLPPMFQVTDELYHVAFDPHGAATEVLAQTSLAKGTQQAYPSIWIVKHPAARIVAIALGHDGRVHELPEFKRLLVNSVAWSAGGN